MFQNKAVRSALVLFAFSGMLAACSSNSGSGEAAPLAPAAQQNAPVELQQAQVKIASVTDANGQAVAMDTSAVLTQIATIDRALVSQEGDVVTIDLGNEQGSIVQFHAPQDMSAITVATENYPVSAAAVTMSDDHTRITEMSLTVQDGRPLTVVLSFIEPQGSDTKQDAKQDTKQDEPKKDEPKKEEPKKEEPKQDQPKQDQPKKEEPKKDQPKQDQPKKDEPKKEEPKKEEPKQDQPKQDQPKQDSKK